MDVIIKIFKGIKIKPKRKTSYLDFCFLFVCVLTLLAGGGFAQEYMFKLLNSENSTVYGSAFENAIAKWPAFYVFISSAYPGGGYNYIAAFFIVLVALFFQSSIQIFVASIVSSVLFLTISDNMFLLMNNGFSLQSFYESLIANAIGSPFISAFIIFLFYIKKSFLSLSNVNPILQHIISYITYALSCFVILIFSYYVLCFFYRPTAVNFTVSTSKNFSGIYFITEKTKKTQSENKNNDEKKLFSLLGSPVRIKNDLTIDGFIQSINSRFKENKSYKVTLNFLLNCQNSNSIKSSMADALIFNNVKYFNIEPSEALSYVQINDKNGYLKASDELVNMFSVQMNDKDGYNVEKHNQGVFSYYLSDSDAGLYVFSPVIDYADGQSTKKVSFKVNIDGAERVFSVNAEKLRSNKKDELVECSSIDLNKIDFKQNQKTNTIVIAGLLVNVIPDVKDEFYSPTADVNNSRFEIKGKLLSIERGGVKEQDLIDGDFSNGYMDGFVLYSYDKLSLNGKNIDVNKTDNILVMGDDIYGHVSSENNLVINGRATLLYRNSLRENKTLWELSSDSEIILGGIGTLLLALFTWSAKAFITTLRKDENINVF